MSKEQILLQKLESLRRRVAERQRAWPSKKIPPPVSEEAVVAFEQQHGITLPTELRAVLTQVSDGLELWQPMSEWNFSGEGLATPFPADELTTFEFPDLDDYIERKRQELGEDEEVNEALLCGQWEQEGLDDYHTWQERIRQATTKGVIWLTEFEGSYGNFIIVTGNAAGQVWNTEFAVYPDGSGGGFVNRYQSIFDFIEAKY
jgi:hypothetical protein